MPNISSPSSRMTTAIDWRLPCTTRGHRLRPLGCCCCCCSIVAAGKPRSAASYRSSLAAFISDCMLSSIRLSVVVLYSLMDLIDLQTKSPEPGTIDSPVAAGGRLVGRLRCTVVDNGHIVGPPRGTLDIRLGSRWVGLGWTHVGGSGKTVRSSTVA